MVIIFEAIRQSLVIVFFQFQVVRLRNIKYCMSNQLGSKLFVLESIISSVVLSFV